MVKKRVHELAKELNTESKNIIKGMTQLGIEVKSHMSTLDEKDVQLYLEKIQGSKDSKKENKQAVKTDEGSAKNASQSQPPQEKIIGQDKKKVENRDRRFERGPGLVDRVPSRPPDRRFEDRSLRTAHAPFKKSAPTQAIPQRSETLSGDAKSDGVSVLQQGGVEKPVERHTPQQNPLDRPKYPEKQRPSVMNKPKQHQATPHQRGSDKRFDGRPAAGFVPQKGPASKGYDYPRNGERFSGGSVRGGGPKPGVDTKQRPASLKVPKVPEQAMGIDKIKASEKSRARIAQNQSKDYGKGRKFTNDFDDRSVRHGQNRKRPMHKPKVEQKPVVIQEKKPVIIGESVTVQSLAEKMKKSPADLIKKLMQLGIMATINQEIDADTAEIVAGEYGFDVEIKIELDAEALLEQEQEDNPDDLVARPCVVTVMGHVDHGKTSLLDAIRQTNVIATEAGGITQHIGAYQVEYNNKKITFLDTPGHEAFTSMRARGAQVTDIAVLVVAAEDGVKPQTIEAINHAKAAEVPIVVAVNKIDKPEANPDRVKQQLTEHNIVPEEWGGDVICVPVSAKQGIGIEELLESILLVAEISELKANPNRDARGTVIEAELDKGRGPVATILVQNGTLHVGEAIVAGTAFGRVRAMMDDKGRRVKKAGPSTPVEVLGFNDVPLAGDIFYVAKDEKNIKQIIEKRMTRKRQEDFKSATPRLSLEDLYKNIQEGEVKELNLVIKADVQGSMEAIRQSLERLSTDEVKVNIVHGGVGAITESDIMLASASNAIVIGFNARPDNNARKFAEDENIDIKLYRVIYDAIDDIRAAMSGLLEPELKENIIGQVEIRQLFKASKLGIIAGCYVTEGKVTRDAGVRLIRDNIVVHEGKIESLKRFKDDVKEVVQGYECGITLENYQDLREEDVIEAFVTEQVKRELG